MHKLDGPFRDIIPVLVKMKRSTGYKYDTIKDYVELDNFLYKKGVTKISQEIYTISVLGEQNPYLKRKRYCALENLNVVMDALNIPTIKMGKIKINGNEKFISRILTINEIKILFNEIDRQINNSKHSMYSVLYRLLYSSGLRISEILSITKSDYNEEYGALRILDSKNLISRNVVLSNSMKKIFDKYISNIKNKDDFIFNISYSTARNFFHKIIIKLSLEPCRIHDLRHTFAVHALYNLLKKMNENKALYYLGIYMGHTCIESTIYYLQLVPKQKRKINKTMKEVNEYIFKEENNETR